MPALFLIPSFSEFFRIYYSANRTGRPPLHFSALQRKNTPAHPLPLKLAPVLRVEWAAIPQQSIMPQPHDVAGQLQR